MNGRHKTTLWREHVALWRDAWRRVIAHRRQVVLITLLLWLPWRFVVPLVDHRLGFSAFAGFPLEWIADALYDPLYGATILAVLAEMYPISVRSALLRGFWLVPRLWLIEIKVAIWGLAVPYLILHLGAAIVLTLWPSYGAARALFAVTFVSMAWVLVVVVRYMLAAAVMVAETQGHTWNEEQAPSTGWALFAARQLIRGNVRQAVLVMAVGQGVISLVVSLLPSGDTVPAQFLNAIGMVVTALWWALLWSFGQFCLSRARGVTAQEATYGRQKAR